jgi:hypothetical protein
MNQPFARRLSFRKVGEATKSYADNPGIGQVESLLREIDAGAVECLTLYGPRDERLFVLGKPGFYHLTLFVDETDGYAFDDGSGDTTKIDIAGDYWPSFRVCKDRGVLAKVAERFYWSGTPLEAAQWLSFSGDD